MEQYVGLDVSQEETHACVVDAQGKVLWQGKCRSTPESMALMLREKAPTAARIGLESGSLSTWHWHALHGMGLPIICIDARHARAALSMQVNKTDKNDAHGLAQIMRCGWYRTVNVKSIKSHRARALLRARAQLVCMRTGLSNQIRGILKTFGIVLAGRTGVAFEKRIEAVIAKENAPGEALQPLLETLRGLKAQIERLNEKILDCAWTNRMSRHLMTVPGVGPLTAIAFVMAVDDPAKFKRSKSVAAYLGLTPRRYQSGEVDHNGRISKCGDPLVRWHLFEAAGVLLTRVRQSSPLRSWGLRLAKRGGMKKAKVAVARKLAVVMHQMMLTGESFRYSVVPAGVAD